GDGVELDKRRGPVEGLGDARRLEEVLLADRLHEADDLLRELRRRLRYAGLQDRELARRVRVVEPMIKAAALQRVVDLARAVRGDDDDRRLLGLDRAELRDGDLEIGQHLEQE